MSGSDFYVKRENLNQVQKELAENFCNTNSLEFNEIKEFGFMWVPLGSYFRITEYSK